MTDESELKDVQVMVEVALICEQWYDKQGEESELLPTPGVK